MAVRVRITSIPLMFLLLCSALLATTLQGVQGEVEVEGPSESECRPYIEKALKKLETGDTQSADVQDDDDDDITHIVTTDDSDTQSGEAIESIEPKSVEEETQEVEDEQDASEKDTGETESVEVETANDKSDADETGDTQEVSGEDKEGTDEEKDEGEQTDAASVEKDGETEEAADSAEKEASVEGDQEVSAEQQETEEKDDGTEEQKSAEEGEEAGEASVEDDTASLEQADEAASAEQADEAASAEQDEAASAEQEGAASVEEGAASIEDGAASVEEAAASAEEGAASAEQEEGAASTEQDDATSAEQGAASVEDATASDEQEEAGASAEQEEGAPSAEEDAPSAEEAAASAEQDATSTEQEGAASVEEGAAASIEEGAASTEQEEGAASTEQEETASAEQEGAASVEEEAAASAEEQAEGSEEKPDSSADKDEASVEQEGDAASAEAEKDEASSEKDASVEQADEPASVEKDASDEKEPSGEKAESAEGEKEESAEKADEDKTKEDVSAEGDADSKQESAEKEQADEESASKEATEEEGSEEGEAESTPEEDLTWEVEIPAELRPREHLNEILNLNDEPSDTDSLILKAADKTLNELKKIYENAIKPLETLYKYRDLSNRHFGDPEIFSKPLVLFMGPWSGGKSSIINYLVDNEYTQTSLRTGAEPSPAYFNLLMWGEEPEVVDGTQLAADWTFSGLQKFGQGLEERLRGLKLPNKLLENINIVEIPGILEVRKQVSRMFPFNDACQWFIDRADIIFLVYDPSKLDVGPETEAILDQLKGREYQTRIILNKADQVKPEELMRVQGALIWNISPLMSSAQPPVMYSTSLWSKPYEVGAPVRLLQAQERALLKDLKTAIDKRIENKIASARRFAVRVRNHAKMVDCYLTTYYNHKSVFGNKKLVSDQIIEHPQDYHIYEGLSTLTNISRYDLPDPDVYRDFFRLNPLYDFQQLSATCTYFRGCPINRLDVAIAYDLPELVGKYKKMVEPATNNNADSSTKS